MTSMSLSKTRVAELPLLRRFPALGSIPRAPLGSFPTPVERVALHGGRSLLVKRDDLSASPIGGNKVRGLEWLLGDVERGDRVLTVGSRGSTHALLTAVLARQLGARVTVVRWDQEMNAAARRVDALLRTEARVIDARVVPFAYAITVALRLRSGAHWIPAGGASPLAILGHVNAALELADQVARGECEAPERVVVPLGTGGTAAGLALGFQIAALGARVVAVRVVPRIVGRVGRILALARATAALIYDRTGERLPSLDHNRLTVEHAFYGGGYGRPIAADEAGERALESATVRLDDTYCRKAFSAALAQPHGTLLWLTFDGRLLQD
jgi:D-cysteine desulfhydrase